ncbi:MAG: NIL domain-containing protein [Elusimicrobia bacterium]|nr:NIL domain-containing protein [Elusimicrobiota bacterium]
MAKKIVKLIFPQRLIKEPLTFKMAKKFNVIPNIRRARVTDTIGELVLELDGEEKNVAMGIDYLVKAGVDVRPVEGDILD